MQNQIQNSFKIILNVFFFPSKYKARIKKRFEVVNSNIIILSEKIAL